MKYVLFLFILFPIASFASKIQILPHEIPQLIPEKMKYLTKEGDINDDQLSDIVVNAYNDTDTKQILLVLLQQASGQYKVAINSDSTLTLPNGEDSIFSTHSIFSEVKDNKLQIVANSSGSRLSERFTFDYVDEQFILSKYERFHGGHRCNLEIKTAYLLADHISNPISLESFTLQDINTKYAESINNNIKKDLDPFLRAQYKELLNTYKRGDLNRLREMISTNIVAYEDPIQDKDPQVKCVPDSYMERYLFLDDPTKTSISNDIAFFLEQTGYYEEAIYLLNKIITRYPNRSVAYINLGDAYWGMEDQTSALDAYQTYIKKMKASGKEQRIPKRIIDRVLQQE